MAFWLAILTGALFAWIATRVGFFETWAAMFNIIISVFVAVFSAPVIIDVVPVAGETSWGTALTLAAIAIGAFLILHGTTYAFITGQANVSLPKIFDTVLAGVLGFLAGFLVLSFAAFLICITPISENEFTNKIGLGRQSQRANISYVCWWCDLANTIVSPRDKKVTGEQVVDELLSAAQPRAKPQTPERTEPNQPNEPSKVETSADMR
jgi:uncharacterized membrane protein required for colicin V production